MPPKIRTVCERFVVNFKHNVVNREDFFYICAVDKLRVEYHYAGVVIAYAELFFGAAHALRLISGNSSLVNFSGNNSSAGKSKSYLLTDCCVGCAAYAVNCSVTDINCEQMKLF